VYIFQDTVRDGIQWRRLITLIYAGWVPHDLASSRSCLALKSEVQLAPYSHSCVEDSPERDRVPVSVLGSFVFSSLRSVLFFECSVSYFLRREYRAGDGPHEGGKFSGGCCYNRVAVLAFCQESLESTAESDLCFPGNLFDFFW
jgi:hypothetical protein